MEREEKKDLFEDYLNQRTRREQTTLAWTKPRHVPSINMELILSSDKSDKSSAGKGFSVWDIVNTRFKAKIPRRTTTNIKGLKENDIRNYKEYKNK